MPTLKKEKTVAELGERLAAAKHLFLTDFTGLSVADLTKLRAELRKDGAGYAVVKNTLVSRLIEDPRAKALGAHFAGPTAIVFVAEDPVAPAKVLKRFSDDVRPLGLKAGYVDGVVLDGAGIAALAAVPPRGELQGRLVGLLASPLRRFAGVLAANPGGLVRILAARSEQLAGSSS